MKTNSLTPEETKVIENKDTEAPFSGKYDKFFGDGLYTCKRCGAPLYRSENKFHSGCGWPSFDDAIIGAIVRTPDADGKRTEITCRRCGAHLGHVFEGERLTPNNVRYCVNSISMKFEPKNDMQKNSEFAYFGGGCFWCLEAVFKIVKGVITITPGYAGGEIKNPSYEKVCAGNTGHAEVVKIEFDPTVISFEGLLEIFFSIHDPTTLNFQDRDIGAQYRSIILYATDAQKEIAVDFIKKIEESKSFKNPIVTEVKALDEFYKAEDYHQDYFAKNSGAPYCQLVIGPKIEKFKKLSSK